MKKIILLLMLPLMFSNFTKLEKKGITESEKKFAVDHLTKTQDDLIKAVSGLSEAQLNYKPASEKWSVLECVQHITLASAGLWQMAQGTLQSTNDSIKKSAVVDDQFIKMIEDRTAKMQAPEPFKPVHSTYKNLNETLEAFKADRAKLIDYVKTTNDNLRNHFAKMPFGAIDTYQVILLISAHTNRHMQQLEEVKVDPNFPKS